MRIKAEYKEEESPATFEEANSCWGFVEALEKNASKPTGVNLYNSKGECLSCVIGAEETFLVYFPRNYEGVGSYSSKGSEATKNLDYWLCGHHGEAAAENLVSRNLLQGIVLEFLRQGGMSERIEWVRD